MRQRLPLIVALVAAGLSAAVAKDSSAAPTAEDVLASYADIAQAEYGDARIAAEKLLAAVKTLTAQPTAETLTGARQAWLAAFASAIPSSTTGRGA
jgi:putative iron-regulated protein